jgi:predicted transcriptional regulator
VTRRYGQHSVVATGIFGNTFAINDPAFLDPSSDQSAQIKPNLAGQVDHVAYWHHNVLRKVVQLAQEVRVPPGITTSIRMPREVRDLYETLARATGRAKNDVMVEVLRVEGQRRVAELALILEGREQAHAGRLSPLADVVARFKTKGIHPTDFDLDAGDASATRG